jgi:hypothetical protein
MPLNAPIRPRSRPARKPVVARLAGHGVRAGAGPVHPAGRLRRRGEREDLAGRRGPGRRTFPGVPAGPRTDPSAGLTAPAAMGSSTVHSDQLAGGDLLGGAGP